jgi:hypothetical protein
MTQKKMVGRLYLFSAGYGLLSLGSCLFDCEVLVLRYETRLARVVQLEVCMAGVLLELKYLM